jgi:Calpain family cysteine protease
MVLTEKQKSDAERLDVRAGEKWWTRLETNKTALIFPSGDPTSADVTQQYMGNCFWLASILAIALKKDGPQHLKDHLLDSGTEWVYGKLYDGGNKPHLMRAKKQYCSQSDGSGGTVKTETSKLWVCMLTVFAAAFKMHEDNPDNIIYDPKNAALLRLNSGYADAALKVLTGAKAVYQSLSTGWYTSLNAKNTAGYPLVINAKKAADLQALFPGAGGAALNHVTVKGIVGGHSYAVRDVGQQVFGAASTQNQAVDAIRIVNPWGRYVQEYQTPDFDSSGNRTDKWKTVDIVGQGDFWIPASHVPHFFEGFYYSEKALGTPL